MQLLQLGAGPYLFLLAELLEATPARWLRPVRLAASWLQLPWHMRKRLAGCAPLTAAYVLLVELSLVPPVLTLAVLSRLTCRATGAVGPRASFLPLIVLVHGNGVNEGQWVLGRIHLALEGIPVVRVNYLEASCLSTEALPSDGLPEVSKAFRAALSAHVEGGELLLVGHSLGALVGLAFAADEAAASERLATQDVVGARPEAATLCRLLAVSGPFHGSDLLAWAVSTGVHRLLWPRGLPPLIRDLMPGSAALQALHQRADLKGRVHSESITGSLDPIVRPHSAELGPLARLPHCAHYCIASSRRFWDEVVRHYDEEFPGIRAAVGGSHGGGGGNLSAQVLAAPLRAPPAC